MTAMATRLGTPKRKVATKRKVDIGTPRTFFRCPVCEGKEYHADALCQTCRGDGDIHRTERFAWPPLLGAMVRVVDKSVQSDLQVPDRGLVVRVVGDEVVVRFLSLGRVALPLNALAPETNPQPQTDFWYFAMGKVPPRLRAAPTQP